MTATIAGLKSLRKIQGSIIESPRGTLTAATFRMIGTLGMKLNQKFYRPDDLETGRLSSFERSHVVSEEAELPFASEANYEQLGYLLGMAIRGGVAGGSPADSLYTYTYAPNLTGASALDTRSIEYGDDVQAFVSTFCFAKDLELSWSLEDVVKVKAALCGQSVATQAFTSAISNPVTLSPIITGTGKLYIDTSWASMVGVAPTAVAATLVDGSFKVVQGQTGIKYADGAIHYTDIAEKKRHVELNLTLAFTSGVAGYFANYKASPQTKMFVGIKFTGPLVGVSSHAELDLFGAYVIDDYDTLDERDGQDIVKLKLVSEYDVTGTAEWQVVLKNGVSAFA